MIWLMMNAATKPPIMLPSPPSANHEDKRTERIPDEGMHVVLQRQQTGAEAGKRAADRRRDEIDAALIDAHEPDDLAVLSDRANGGADISALEEEIERGRSNQRHAEGQQ